MQGIFDLLKIPDTEVLNSTMEALIKICEINYIYMGPYLQQIFQVTQTLIETAGDDEEARKIAHFSIEAWNTMCEAEIDMTKDPSQA